eukprot:313929-Chlamydomonas_euryale.AAC.4
MATYSDAARIRRSAAAAACWFRLVWSGSAAVAPAADGRRDRARALTLSLRSPRRGRDRVEESRGGTGERCGAQCTARAGAPR